ncbi:MAG: hypothetical protein ACR2KV_15865 [Solirubrobacteraceae bacterium]
MPQPRNPLTYLIIGSVIGLILGAVVGIAIGGGSGRSSRPLVSTATVISTRTIRLPAAPGDTSPPFAPHTTTTATTPPVDTTTLDTTTLDTTTTTTATDTTPSPSPPDPNSVPPADPYNPPSNFCVTHVCGPNFSQQVGFAVQCADGIWSMAGGSAKACRNDGGVG